MKELMNLFVKLNEYLSPSLHWERVELIYNELEKARKNDGNTQPSGDIDNNTCDGLSSDIQETYSLTMLPILSRTINDAQVMSTMLDLCTLIRSIRDSETSYDNTYDCWDQVIKVCPREPYLAYIYAIAGLANFERTNVNYAKLSLTAASTYFLSLTIPGAKGFHIFNEDIIEYVLHVFELLGRTQKHNDSTVIGRQASAEILVHFVTLCDDLKLLLRYVHFNDYQTSRDRILRRLIDIHFLYYEKGFTRHTYYINIFKKSYEILEEMINAHNGEPEETLMKILNMTIYLHIQTTNTKMVSTNLETTTNGTDCDHISDWFIWCIAKYPTIVSNVLKFYIEWVVTNPIKTWKPEQVLQALEYAAKYDAALYTKCNVSCLEFVREAIFADEVMIRLRAVEFISRILMLDTHVDWQIFRHEVSNIPREVYLIKELIDSLQDINNNMKWKAVQALQTALLRGSPNAQRIMREGLQFAEFTGVKVALPEEPPVRKREVRYSKPTAPTPAYTFEGHDLLQSSFARLPELIYTHIFQNQIAYIRRAGIIFMEHIVKLNPLVIFNTNFVAETSHLIFQTSTNVRKQTLIMIDNILTCYPNCFLVIWVWCRIIAPMLRDADPKNIELAIECFQSKVLLNIRAIEESNAAEHFMPWVIVRTLLSTNSRLYLQTCLQLAFHPQMLNLKLFSMIESHLVTTNSTEAWILLNFITGKLRKKEPDSLIHRFTSMQSWNNEQNMLVALEVLGNCIDDFSHSALNFVFKHILSTIHDGTMLPLVIGKAFDLLVLIDKRSQEQGVLLSADHRPNGQWLGDLHALLEAKTLAGVAIFPDDRARTISYLFSYSEVNLQTQIRPHRMIVTFVQRYMRVCHRIPEAELDLENERVFNAMIVIAGRFSLRDPCVASATCTSYVGILTKIDRPPIVNTIIVAVADLCKKHAQIVENMIVTVLKKLQSPYAVNRIETFKCLESLVLQDQLKLRGPLLLFMLASLLDANEELALRATEFFNEFVSKKNATLFQKCLAECPFVLNQYKNFNDMDDLLGCTMITPLGGEAKRKQRHRLYNKLMDDIDDINLILYYGHLTLIAEKSKNDPMLRTDQGIALLKDILYILRRVCEVTKVRKSAAGSKDTTENNENLDAMIDNVATPSIEIMPADGATPQAGVASGRGRRRRDAATMLDALNVLEKSLALIAILHHRTHEWTSTLAVYFDHLGFALNKRFPNLIGVAQPAEFWNKYRTTHNTEAIQSRSGGHKRKSTAVDDSASEDEENGAHSVVDDEDSDGMNGDDVLAPALAKRRADNSDISIEYLFNPNISF